MKASILVVTGGAGFIGSHLAEELLEQGKKVTVLDNLSSGRLENVRHLMDNPSFTVAREDLKNSEQIRHVIQESEIIFHLAANPEVRVGETDPRIHFTENVLATFSLCEAVRSTKSKILVFASTSTVYGEASQIPTSEGYAPLIPISTYGASKLACEALILSYAHTFNHRALILRLANVIGPRSNHGVLVDLVRKINENPIALEILGDGTQEKSYIHITDCIKAIMHVTNMFEASDEKLDIYNVGSLDRISVKEIAEIVSTEMGKPRIRHRFTGGVDGGRGWKGDVKTMQLSVEKLLRTGWTPKYTSEQAIRSVAKVLAGARYNDTGRRF